MSVQKRFRRAARRLNFFVRGGRRTGATQMWVGIKEGIGQLARRLNLLTGIGRNFLGTSPPLGIPFVS